jgi:hypothetical protein
LHKAFILSLIVSAYMNQNAMKHFMEQRLGLSLLTCFSIDFDGGTCVINLTEMQVGVEIVLTKNNAVRYSTDVNCFWNHDSPSFNLIVP